MHWVSDPCYYLASPTDSTYQVRKFHPHVFRSHSCDDGYSPCPVFRIQDIDQPHKFCWVHLVTDLYFIRSEGEMSFGECLKSAVFEQELLSVWALYYLDTKRIGNAPKELHMGTIKLASTLSNP